VQCVSATRASEFRVIFEELVAVLEAVSYLVAHPDVIVVRLQLKWMIRITEHVIGIQGQAVP
jgi:hypothetical protein